MIRRLATAVAATTALVLASAAPALAGHETPELVPGNPTCADVAALFDIDDVESLGKDEGFGDGDQTTDIDADDYPDHDIFVIVKGGPNAHVFFEPPFHDLYAPDNVGGNQADISHVEVCGVEKEVPPPGEEDEVPPPGEEDEVPPPGDEEEDVAPEDEDENGEDENGEDKPVAVPTEVPAGYGDSGAGSAGTVGLLALIATSIAGLAVVARRRFLNES